MRSTPAIRACCVTSHSSRVGSTNIPTLLQPAKVQWHCDPQNPVGLFLLATLYQDSGDATRATSTYQQVLKVKPDHAIALNNLAVLLTSDDKAVAAVLLARRAVALIPKNSALQDH